ncbi:MAG: peptidylprolyl isomerase, partial [Anaerotignum sp.]|nr:peptidylprolyl isomerase [Anaerotignum sp.]
SQFFIVQQKSVMEDALRVLTEARDNNEEEIGVTLTDGNYYTLSQLYPDEVLDHYKAQGGSVHLEYIFGGAYSIFGQVFEGLEAIDEIAAVETDENDKPLNDVIIESITFENYKAQ